MKKLLSIVAVFAAGAGGLTQACTITTVNNGDDGGVANTDSGTDTSTDSPTANDSGNLDGGTEAEAAAPVTNLRFTNWSPDAPGVGFDFCLATHGTSMWQGPVLAGAVADADAGAGSLGDGGVTGLQFPSVTTYFQVDPGQFDVRIVQAGATDCNTGIGTDATGLPPLAANGFTTFATVGDVTKSGNDQTVTTVAYADDTTAPSGSGGLRFVNAAPDLAAIDMGTGTLAATRFVALFTNVQFAAVGSQAGTDAGTVDSNGYLATTQSSVEFSVHTSQGGTTDTATASSQSITAGSLVTMALVNGKNGGPPPQFLVCTGDGMASPTSLLSSCSIVSQ
jgi:hypothetical protein